MKRGASIKIVLGLCGLFAVTVCFAETPHEDKKSASPMIFHQEDSAKAPTNQTKEAGDKKSAKPAPLSSYRPAAPKKKPSEHLQNEFVKGALRLIWDLEVGLRFDRVAHDGAAELTYTRGSEEVNATAVNNTLSLTLVERLLGLKILFFDTAFIRGLGTYSVNSTNLHVRQGVDWAPSLGNFSSEYFLGDAYGYDAELALGIQGQPAKWFSCFFEVGGAYHRLWISDSHDLRFLVPFARIGNTFHFARKWSFSYSGGAWAMGRRKELLTPVLINVYGVDLTDGSVETPPSLVRSGHIYGFECKASIEYAISARWGVSLNYTLQTSRSVRRRLGPVWNNPQLEGWWDERTMWNSHQVRLGVNARF